jgi:hypothetical protein
MHKALLFLLLLSSQAFGQTQFYVSPAGDNAAAGTLLQPWKTAQYALDHAVPGCTINLMGGSYHENLIATASGTANNPVVLTSYAGQSAVIDGNGTSGDYLLKLSGINYFTVQRLEFTGLSRNNACGILIDGNSGFLGIKNNKIHEINFSADANNPVLPGKSAHAIAVMGTDALSPVSTITITGNEIFNCRTGKSPAVEISGNADSYAINRNKIYDITNSGIGIIANKGISADALNDRPKNGLIAMNTISNCLSSSEAAAGILVDGAMICRIENNCLYSNTTGLMVCCMAIGRSALSVDARDNVIYNNREAGIQIGGTGYPAQCGSVDASGVKCNTLFDNNTSGNSAELVLGFTNSVTISSNIFDAHYSTQLVKAEQGNLLMMNFNLFYTQSIPEFRWNGNPTFSFTTWQTITGFDSGSLFANPQMVSPVGANLHLEMNSPAIDRGDTAYMTVSNEVDMDTMTRVQNGRVDIGADEYGTTVGIQNENIPRSEFLFYDFPGTDLQISFWKPQIQNSIVYLYDSTGKIVGKQEAKKGDSSITFPGANLAKGIYFVSMNGSTLKIIR